MDALVTAWLDVMPDAFRPSVRDAIQRGHAGLRRATLRYNVAQSFAHRTPRTRKARDLQALRRYRHGDSNPGFRRERAAS
jgi:hypothetical protein